MANEEGTLLPDWLSLPNGPRQACFDGSQHGYETRANGMRTCTAIAHMLLRAPGRKLHLELDVTRAGSIVSARLLQRLWDPSGADGVLGPNEGVRLVLRGSRHNRDDNPQRYLRELQKAGVVLSCVDTLELKELQLDALIPAAIATLLPNLRVVMIRRCTGCTGCTGCPGCPGRQDAGWPDCTVVPFSKLERMHIFYVDKTVWNDNFSRMLDPRYLPSLASVWLHYYGEEGYSTDFLSSIGSQLTNLYLDNACRVGRGTWAFNAIVRNVARCTHLRSLELPGLTRDEVLLLRPLTQLRHLVFNSFTSVAMDVVDALLTHLPSITSLKMETTTLSRSYADRDCRWQKLRLAYHTTPRQLAYLPLRALTEPVRVSILDLNMATVADVRAAVDNIPPGLAEGTTRTIVQNHNHTPIGTHAPSVLAAVQPLLPRGGVLKYMASGCCDAELIKVLGRLASTFDRVDVQIHEGVLRCPGADFAGALPNLRYLTLTRVEEVNVMWLASFAAHTAASNNRQTSPELSLKLQEGEEWPKLSLELREGEELDAWESARQTMFPALQVTIELKEER